MRTTLRQTTRPGRRRRSVGHVANPEDERVETGYERADRNLNELLQELRVALPGVQVLFGFLLTVPFMERFQTLTSFQKRLYFATLLTTALSIFGVILLVSDFVFEGATPVVATGGTAIVFAWLWFVLPMIRRARLDDEPGRST